MPGWPSQLLYWPGEPVNDSAPTIGMPCVLATAAASLTELTVADVVQVGSGPEFAHDDVGLRADLQALERAVVRLDRELQAVLVAELGEAIVIVLGEKIAERAAEIPQEAFGRSRRCRRSGRSASAGRGWDRSRGV